MARPAKGLWWNERAEAWFLTVREGDKRKQLNLGADRTRAEIALGERRAKDQAPAAGDSGPFAAVAGLFLDYIQASHPKSYAQYQYILKSFLDSRPGLRVKDIAERSVFAWLDSKPAWGDGARYNAITVLLSCLHWARKSRQSLIRGEYLVGIVRPRVRSRGRKAVFTYSDHAALVEVAPAWLADVLEALWQTGARPSEICSVTAADCDFLQRIILLDEHKTADKTGEPRVIDMSETLLAICRRLAKLRPEGAIFRGGYGRPLTPPCLDSACRFYRKAKNLPGKIIPYGYRHSLATHLLEAGTDPQIVARILGHKSTAMLWKHYAHLLADRPAHRDAIKKVRG